MPCPRGNAKTRPGLQAVGVSRAPAALLGMGVVAGLRLAAIAWELRLPGARVHEEEPR